MPAYKQEKTNQVQQWNKPLNVEKVLDEFTSRNEDKGCNDYPKPAKSLQYSHNALLSSNNRCLAVPTLAELLDEGDGTESDINAAFRNQQWKVFETAAPSMPSLKQKVEPVQWKLNTTSAKEMNQYKALTEFVTSILEEDVKEKKSVGLAFGSDQLRTIERLG